VQKQKTTRTLLVCVGNLLVQIFVVGFRGEPMMNAETFLLREQFFRLKSQLLKGGKNEKFL
jgi:hypothetical protein